MNEVALVISDGSGLAPTTRKNCRERVGVQPCSFLDGLNAEAGRCSCQVSPLRCVLIGSARSRDAGGVGGGGRGIRTPGTVTRSVVFKTTAIDHSAIPPRCNSRGFTILHDGDSLRGVGQITGAVPCRTLRRDVNARAAGWFPIAPLPFQLSDPVAVSIVPSLSAFRGASFRLATLALPTVRLFGIVHAWIISTTRALRDPVPFGGPRADRRGNLVPDARNRGECGDG